MGCDIHAHMEIKVDGEWFYYAPVHIRRNYALFTRLANVRPGWHATIEPISDPRGLPDDLELADTTKLHLAVWNLDGHSHSWISSQEFVDLIEWIKDNDLNLVDRKSYSWNVLTDDWLYLFGSAFDDFYKYPEDNYENVEDFRMIFWFDN